ncbi:globin-coupled sensor protein [Bosea sp. 124]|uniref:globin-coupled sensor protein n=1 Tax=Bosea sp. 124 TaxID=2135642 RepID=UPI0024A6CCB2|nr:globin-coupled sensor protein [Bosea sp. 124]
MPDILDGFYSHIQTFPDAAQLFRSAEVIAHAREMQIAHWDLITDGAFDGRYAASVRRIGEVHYRLGLEPRSYIGAYSFIITRLINRVRVIDSRWRVGRESRKWKMATALNRAALLDMDLAISVYLEAARRNRRETLDRLAANFEQVVATVVRSVSSAANDLQSSTGLLAASSSETMHEADAASDASMEATRNIETIASATDQLAASLNEIGHQIATSGTIATRAVSEAEQITSQVGGLSGSVDRIDGIVDVIRAIADKTKLLALNASIEAARAGETGRGFSVVAAEVKQLAVQTEKATAEIDSQIGTIRDFTRYVAAAVGTIRQTIREMNDIGSVVAGAIERQEDATQQTARNVQQAWQRSAEVANNIVGVTRLASDSSAASARALSATTDLARQIEKLTSEAEKFLARVGVS